MSEARGRLDSAFVAAREAGRAALVVFVEAGDPDLATTARLLPALATAGADILEVGVPFSDPIADGVAIQRASERALASGTNLTRVLGLVASFRSEGHKTPVVLFSYSNPILAMGEDAFIERALAAGVDGVLLTDLPPEEGRGFARKLLAKRLSPVYLLAPTSTGSRMKAAANLSRGFVYLVSRAGVTGVRSSLPEGLGELVARVRANVAALPIAVGFGISDPDQVREAARLADGVVVGSAVVQASFEGVLAGRDPVEEASSLVARLAAATFRT